MSDYANLLDGETTSTVPKPPRITRTRWQLVRWHLRCAWLHALGKLR